MPWVGTHDTPASPIHYGGNDSVATTDVTPRFVEKHFVVQGKGVSFP